MKSSVTFGFRLIVGEFISEADMRDGIYFVVFTGQGVDLGTGTVVVSKGRVSGGDFGYTYRGVVNGQSLDLHVSNHEPRAQNVLGLNDYVIQLTISDAHGGYHLAGSIPGHPQLRLEVNAKFIGDLA